jgi:hypothetical protein
VVSHMRGMHLPNCVIPDSEEWAAGLYWTRMRKGLALPLELSFLLSAYVLWPSDGDEPKRNSWVSTLAEATHVAHDKKTALSDVSELFGGISSLLRPALSAVNDEVVASETRGASRDRSRSVSARPASAPDCFQGFHHHNGSNGSPDHTKVSA